MSQFETPTSRFWSTLCVTIMVLVGVPLAVVRTIWIWISLDINVFSSPPRIGIIIIWFCLIPLYFVFLSLVKDILYLSRPGYKHILIRRMNFKDLKKRILDTVKEYKSIEVDNRIKESEDSVKEVIFAPPVLKVQIKDLELEILVKKSPYTSKNSWATVLVWRIIIGKIKNKNKKESTKIEKILTKKLQKYIIET